MTKILHQIVVEIIEENRDIIKQYTGRDIDQMVGKTIILYPKEVSVWSAYIRQG